MRVIHLTRSLNYFQLYTCSKCFCLLNSGTAEESLKNCKGSDPLSKEKEMMTFHWTAKTARAMTTGTWYTEAMRHLNGDSIGEKKDGRDGEMLRSTEARRNINEVKSNKRIGKCTSDGEEEDPQRRRTRNGNGYRCSEINQKRRQSLA